MNFFTKNSNLIKIFFLGGEWRRGGGVRKGGGARVSDFFYRESKSKKKYFWSGCGEGVRMGAGESISVLL